MGQWTKARIQLCGRFVADIDGSRIEDTLPGRIGRVLFAYLVLNRGRPLPRDTLLMAGWGEDAPAEARNALNVLLSKLRHGLGAEHLRGRTEIELLLPPATFVDAEAALEGAHRAESAIAEGRWAQAWGPAGIAYHVATRPFLTGLEAPWIDEWRRRLEEVRLRGLECFAAASLGLGGPALAQAEERARMLTELAPYRETGHRLLMEALARRGNVAEALRAYERLRVLLREELGIAPSPTVQGVHRRLLDSAEQLELLGLREDVLARHVANQLGVQDAHMALRVPPELVVVVALDDIPAHADDPQRHRQPPGQPAAIFTRDRRGRKHGTAISLACRRADGPANCSDQRRGRHAQPNEQENVDVRACPWTLPLVAYPPRVLKPTLTTPHGLHQGSDKCVPAGWLVLMAAFGGGRTCSRDAMDWRRRSETR